MRCVQRRLTRPPACAGIGAASEWQDICKEAAQALLILIILERLHLRRTVSWLEDVRMPAKRRCLSPPTA